MFPDEIKVQDQSIEGNNLKAEKLFVVHNKFHKHITAIINNSLFLRQGNFKLPPDNEMIHGKILFEIFPSAAYKNEDRIWNQMRYVPHHLADSQENVTKKLILIYSGYQNIGDITFSGCPVHRCSISVDQKLSATADVIMWITYLIEPPNKRPPGQIWLLYILESPAHVASFPAFEDQPNHQINWTATYRSDSTIVAPYFKYTPYDLIHPPPDKYPLPDNNFAAGKTKMVAWFVSNCNAENERMLVAEEINQYVEVDIFGNCKTLKCNKNAAGDCFQMLNKQYKFYLSFENSNCHDYVTEKFFLNGLSNNVIPIVMGAPPSYYKRVAPPHSFIHIEDFKTIKLLADYLKYLDKNDTAYNEYFSWKGYGLVDTNTFFWCRLCMMAHEGDKEKRVLKDVYKWWNGPDNTVCIGKKRWSEQDKKEE